MTDDEIDAAILAAVPAECFTPNVWAREIYRAGYRAGIRALGCGLLDCVDRHRGADNARNNAEPATGSDK